jgi:hypothetical protein
MDRRATDRSWVERLSRTGVELPPSVFIPKKLMFPKAANRPRSIQSGVVWC